MKKDDLLNNELIVPRNEELERTLLGEILVAGSNGYLEIENLISTKSFYGDTNATIFLAIAQLAETKRDINPQELFQELYREGKLDYVGGAPYIASLASNIVSTHALEQHAKELRQCELKRGAYMLAEKLREMASDNTLNEDEVLEFADKGITELQSNVTGQVFTMDESLSRYYEWSLDNECHQDRVISSGLQGLDQYLDGGFRAPDLIVVGGRPSMGKALRIDSHVLTPSGWKLMGDIKVGDEVVAIDGTTSHVTGVFPQGELETYKVTFQDGRTTECCGEHLWEVYSTKFGRKGGETRVLNTKQIEEKLQAKRFKGRMSIPKFSGIFGEHKEFVIHPYILGILLGDGCLSKGTSWCKPDMFIKEKIESLLPYGYTISQKDEKTFFIINSKKGGTKNIFTEELRELGLIGSHSYDKFIPEKYKMCSRDQRVQLLQGLLDSDGFADKGGIITFSSASIQLAKDVQELCWSLGYVCSLRKKEVYLNGERKRDAYIICISTNTPDECFSLPRKRARANEKKRCRPNTIKSIEKTGRKVECQCISVSHERALYVTDQYIMTHNTALAVHFAEQFVYAGKNTLFFSLEMTDIQLIHRMVAKNGLSSSHVRRGRMTQEERAIQEQNMGFLQGKRLYIASSEAHKQLSAIKAEAYRFKRAGKVDAIIIDYLQYIKTRQRFEKRYMEVGYITSELKSLAKELNVPIILLAQLGRKNDADADNLPKMEDLRESGNIEQDADIIIFPHRPWVYNNEAIDQTGRSWKDRGVLYIAKNREGMRNVKTYFMTDPQFKEFSDDEQANEQLPHE